MFLGIKPRVLIEQGKLLVFPWSAHTCHPVRVLNILFFMHVFWRECVCVCERERERERENICDCVCMCDYMMGKCIYKCVCMGI